MSDQRYPTAVRLIGVMVKDANKMFMTSVLWSDDSEIIVYRSFKEFKKLHKQLKKLFPSKNPFHTSERVIPRFRAGNANVSHRKDSSKSLRRLSLLEDYCTALLKCEPSVTRSSELIQFFRPQHQDLQPEFGKNSVVIVSLEDIGDGKDRGVDTIGGKRFSVGNVTQPYVPETYRCVAPYETKDTQNRPFRVAVDEAVEVLIKDKAGWWLVENDNKCLAWFPAPYLVKCEDEDEEDDSSDGTAGFLYHAVRNYTSTNEDEVTVHIGSVVEVLQKSDNGWWLIRNKGRAGYVPSMYLKPYNNPLAQVRREMWGSALHVAQLHNSTDRLTPLPEGSLGAVNKIRSHSLDVLSVPHRSRVLPPVPTENQRRKGSVGSEVSLGSGSSFSDDSSWTGSDSLSGSPAGASVLRAADGGLAEGGFGPGGSALDPMKLSAPPKVPPRPRDQEILARCTTFTRKAALASKARLPEFKQMQGR